MCGLVRILFLFSLKKKPAVSSALYKNGRPPFSPLQAGMSVSSIQLLVAFTLVCISKGNGAYPLPWSLGCPPSAFLKL